MNSSSSFSLKDEIKDDSYQPNDASLGSQDDGDDWSRQVETDSLLEETRPQPQRQLTLKEKLVMRERERRIETERARLKRQFALSNVETTLHADVPALRENDSVAETLGEESIVAHPDEENIDEARLGFNMERFLRNSNSFDPQAKPAEENKEALEPGVLMERFLNEPVIPEGTGIHHTQVDRNVDGIHDESTIPQSPLIPSFGEYTLEKPSTVVESDHDDIIVSRSVDGHDAMSDVASSAHSRTHHDDEPRVLRLTEADMEELAAIDEASIGNAPPSEREETLSEIGELVGFGGMQATPFGMGSNGTQTTAQDESVTTSILSGIQNNHTERDQQSVDASHNIPLQLGLSPPASSNGTNEANPPSIRDDETPVYQHDASSMIHYDSDFVAPNQTVLTIPSSNVHEENKDGTASDDIRSVEHEIDVIHIAAPASPLPVDMDLTTGNWSPNGGGMHISPIQLQKLAECGPIPNYGSLESGGMFSKMLLVQEEGHSARKEAEPLLSKVPPEVAMQGTILELGEAKMNITAVFAIGIVVGLAVGILIGAAIIPLVAK